MLRDKIFWVFVSLLVFFMVFPSLAQNQGTLSYQSTLDTKERIHEVSGKAITGHFQLNYQPTLEGDYDGDSGLELYFQFDDEKTLTPQKSYAVGNSVLEVYLVYWGSPAAYKKWGPKELSGTITILEYQPRVLLKLKLNMSYQDIGGKKTPLQREIALRAPL